ncbi:MAG: RagB/SusD family nutrient uptake outer membrane protein [Dysgonamonadaceae bacterium]|jgi:hypothetical protein|nr:RagB/SusD family nutrient uptake outer membrane protein [Dysgonamonadaceae bacterium]
MKNINKILSLFLIAVLAIACDDDYLNTSPTDQTGSATAFASTKNAAMAINGILKIMTRQYSAGGQGFNGEGTIKMYFGNYPSEDIYINLPGWITVMNGAYVTNNASQYNYYPWYYYYRIVGDANSVILNIDDAEGPDNEKQFIKAQALTLRSYAFMMLAQFYGNRWQDSDNGATKAIVLRLEPTIGEQDLSTLAETYNQIYADLDEAIKLFTASKLKRNENFSPDINVAYAVYARAAIDKQDYSKASEMAKKAREGYPLMSVADYKAGFCNPTSEWIWSSYGGTEETLYYYSFHAYMAYNSNASAVRSYPKCISKYLYNQIPTSDIRKGFWLDPTGHGSYTASTGKAGSTLDAYARNYVKENCAPYALEANATVYAYMQYKIACFANPGVAHLNHFRSSEMYLIEAESEYKMNNEAKAQSLLVELNKTSGRDPLYSCTKTGNDLYNEIKKYYKIELWGEGYDWFLKKRWNDSMVRRSYTDPEGNFSEATTFTLAPDANNKWTYVIPLKETDYNPAILGN